MTRARTLADYVAGGTTAAEFDYMDGVTSNVQTQMNAKAPLASPAFTGTPTGITAAHLEAGVLPSDVTGGSGLDAVPDELTHYSTWHMDTGVIPTTGASHIFTTWTKATNQSNGSLGSDMTHSSGIFTFPATGVWLIKFQGLFYSASTQSVRYCETAIETTTDDATWVETARAINSLTSYNSSSDFASCSADLMWDVTSTSNNKVKFKTYQYTGESVSFYGATTNNFTYATFIRLGDT